MGCCQGKSNKKEFSAGGSGGKHVGKHSVYRMNSPIGRSQPTMDIFLTVKERTAMLELDHAHDTTRLLLSAPFSNFSAFTEQLYLTGLGGVTLDNLKQHHIKCLVNVAEEIQQLELPNNASVVALKYPIVDSYNYEICNYFDEAADQIYKMLQEDDGNVVVYCSAGMSRSSAIVIAFAIKHLQMTLKEAFSKMQEVRPYARPNLAFFHQLVQYERECLGANSVEMVQESMSQGSAASNEKKKKPSLSGPRILVPNLYRKDFPQLFKLEVAEARRANHPMMLNAGAKSSRKSKKSALSKKGSKKAKSSRLVVAEDGADGTCMSNELKPFVVETVCYADFIAEFEQLRAKVYKDRPAE